MLLFQWFPIDLLTWILASCLIVQDAGEQLVCLGFTDEPHPYGYLLWQQLGLGVHTGEIFSNLKNCDHTGTNSNHKTCKSSIALRVKNLVPGKGRFIGQRDSVMVTVKEESDDVFMGNLKSKLGPNAISQTYPPPQLLHHSVLDLFCLRGDGSFCSALAEHWCAVPSLQKGFLGPSSRAWPPQKFPATSPFSADVGLRRSRRNFWLCTGAQSQLLVVPRSLLASLRTSAGPQNWRIMIP